MGSTANAFTVTSSAPLAFSRNHAASSKIIPLYGSGAIEKKLKRQKWSEERGYTSEAFELAELGKPGLKTNEEGLEFVKLVHPETGASSEIYLLGGVVTSYIVGEQEYIAVRPD